jgi:hypothetical protein
MDTDVDPPLSHGDRVTAARDLHTTRGFRIARGAHGIVAEDRGSKLVVFFNEQDSAVDLTEPDVSLA